MNNKPMEDCVLCGNRRTKEGQPCDICGGHNATFFSIPLGYLYPFEARMLKTLLISLILITLVIIGTVVYLVYSYQIRIDQLLN